MVALRHPGVVAARLVRPLLVACLLSSFVLPPAPASAAGRGQIFVAGNARQAYDAHGRRLAWENAPAGTAWMNPALAEPAAAVQWYYRDPLNNQGDDNWRR